MLTHGINLGIVKTAQTYRVDNQSFLPVGERRNLTAAEEQEIAEAQSKILPKIFDTYADKITEDMSSPMWSGVGAGTLGAGLGGILGAGLGSALGPLGFGGGGLLGASIGGLGAGALGYWGRDAENQKLLELMRRLPEGAVRRDMLSDSVYQRDQDRVEQARADRNNKALMLALLSK
jgi:hypothetical protein